MRLRDGKRDSSSDARRSSGCTTPRRTTSADWAEWLEKIKGFVGGINTELPPKDTRPFVEVELMGRVFMALLDTGSVVNLVGRDVSDYLCSQGVVPIEQTVPLRMADGSKCEASVSFRLTGELGEKRWTGDALYIPALSTDMILGIGVIEGLELLRVGTEAIRMDVCAVGSGREGCLANVTGSE